MANLSLVIVPAKALTDGRHKVRISVSHNGGVRYIVTDVIVDSPNEFKNGRVIKRHNANELNLRLRKTLSKYEDVLHSISYIDGLTCAELVSLMKSSNAKKHYTLGDIYEEYLVTTTAKATSLYNFKYQYKVLTEFMPARTFVEHINHLSVAAFDKHLRARGIADATVKVYMCFLRLMINYAVKHGYVKYDVNPLANYKMPPITIRQSWLSVDEIRAIRDVELEGKAAIKVRDIFMLSYYLGGVNMEDLSKMRFDVNDLSVFRYVRSKTSRVNTREVEFEMPEEAKEIIRRYVRPDGYLFASRKSSTICGSMRKHLDTIGELAGIGHIIYYSARKSFAQHAYVLGVNESIIDYCLGHAQGKSGTALFAYIKVSPEMATKAVQLVLANLKK